MSDTIRKPDRISPESYNPKKPELLGMVKNVLKNEHSLSLPYECIIAPKDKIAPFSGERWPYSNVEPAIYGALGLFYGRTVRRDETGALINDDIEYAIHNVLTGHAFGLFYCLPDDSLSMAAYGFSSFQLKMGDYSKEEIITIIKDQIYRGNAVHIDEGNGPFDYLLWGYRDNGNVLLGYKFEHGNDMLNCSYDFEKPSEFDSLTKRFSDAALFQPNGEKLGGITFYQPDGERLDREVIYRQALLEGYCMLTQIEPPPAMDFSRVHFGYGQAIYDEWIRQLEQANAESSETFYYASPVFPHFLALYENRLQLYKFLKIYAEMNGDENLLMAAGLCEQLKGLAMEAAQIGFENKYSKPEILAMTNNQRRVLLIDLLKKCRALELEIAEQIKIFTDSPESYSPKKPEIVRLTKKAEQDRQLHNLSENMLSGIPPMRYGNPSAVCFIGTVMRLMDFLHDPVDQDELFALSGTALCFSWREASNCDEVSIIPAIPQRTFAALGYESEYLYEPDISLSPRKYTKEFYIDKIKQSIDRGRPVVGFGFTHQNYTCLITGYYNGGNGLYLRAFWTPEGSADGYDTDDHYYSTETWYETCYGIVVVGEKTDARLTGTDAYRHLKESANIYAKKQSVESQGMLYAMGSLSFDRMKDWLLDDSQWQQLTYHGTFLAPCGILLLNHYRWRLSCYLNHLSEQIPGLVNPTINAAIGRLGQNVPGASQSRLNLHECVDPTITDFSMMCDRTVREKVAVYVEQLKKMDQEIFACLIGTEAK